MQPGAQSASEDAGQTESDREPRDRLLDAHELAKLSPEPDLWREFYELIDSDELERLGGA